MRARARREDSEKAEEMALPRGAERLRQQAAASQARRNFIGAACIFGFVGSVFAYSILAVGGDDALITDRDIAEFRLERERKRAQERRVG